MDIKIIILVSVAFLNFALGATIFFQNFRSAVNKWFAAFAFSLGFWTFSMMVYENVSENWFSVYIWSLILHFAGGMIAYSFFYFTLVYPRGVNPLNRVVRFLFHLPILLVFYFLFLDKTIIIDLKFIDGVRNLVYGPTYPVYFSYFFIYMVGGILTLVLKTFKSVGLERKRVLLLLLTVLIPLTYSGIINMILPAIGVFKYAWTGPIALLMVVFLIAYGIIKYNFFDIKVIATEIFAILLFLVSIISIFEFSSIPELVTRILVFILTVIFAIMIIRSVHGEVERREELEKLTIDLKKTSQKLASANRELKRLDKSKSEFLSIASHKLRTPLTVVKGYVSMILEGSYGKVPKLIHQNLEKVYISTERLIGLVESLLNISRIESGKIEYNIKPVDITNITKSIVDGFQQKAIQKGLSLEFIPDPKVPKVSADPAKVEEVISNIIDNSIKYTPSGSIMVSIHQESQSVVFSCQDTGIGILSEDVPKLFKKFYRGKDMHKNYSKGAGLGMYFARMIVENMGGRIWAESPGKDKGSKFSFSLPLADKGRAKKVEGV